MATTKKLKYIRFNIGVLHLELTSRCNALCPMCGRTTGMDGAVEGGEVILKKRDDVELLDTDPKLLANMIEEMKPHLPNHVFINGNFGDPIMYPHLLDLIRMYKDAGVPQVTLSTNGSVHKTDWWEKLAGIMRKPDKVIFAIDGLEDTNHLYRVNTNFKKIMENAKAFINAGGLARWDFIAFAHNEHQIEEAKALADKMGFVKFRYKKSNRYVIPTHYAGESEEKVETKTELKFVAKQHVAMEKKKAKTTEEKAKAMATILKAPEKTDSANTTNNVENVIKKHKTFDNYVKATDIECQTMRDKSIYVDYEEDNKIMNERYGEGFNDLSKHSIFDILNSPYFSNDLVESWEINSPNRLWICGKTCGKELDFRGNGEKNFEDTEMNEYA